ncbi:MAG TPA: hypothetical protein VK627_09285 [Edaphobacter sp.]|nr:hypothetical protein [Edaphobacter sp.]
MEVLNKKDFRLTLKTDPRWELVQRINASSHFSSSPRLKQLLVYVADCALRDVPEEATEQQIGVRVFNRTPGYNSSEDSIVRSQARLLRIKLAAYFASEGIDEPLIMEVPKGHYLPVFHAPEASVDLTGDRPLLPAAPDSDLTSLQGDSGVSAETGVADPLALPALPLASPPVAIWMRSRWTMLLLVAMLLLAAGAYWLGRRGTVPSYSSVDQLWKPFLTGDPPLLIYSNARFIGNSTDGLRYATEANTPHPSNLEYVESYSGIGEVTAVHDLTELFDARHASFILKRSLLVTWDEAEIRNLVFIGSIAENPALKVLPLTQDFTLLVSRDNAGIINHRPGPGEAAIYRRPEHPLASDYAIVALRSGLESNRHILIFSGMTTLGTQAAVEFACSPESVADLIRRAGSNKDGSVRPFEAVVQTTISGGVPLNTHLVAFHQR